MIEDDAGLWIVQRGSKLPDSSIVSSIEQRGGKIGEPGLRAVDVGHVAIPAQARDRHAQ